jgi:hypothetical protein
MELEIMLSEISQAHKRHFLSFVEAKGKQNKKPKSRRQRGGLQGREKRGDKKEIEG